MESDSSKKSTKNKRKRNRSESSSSTRINNDSKKASKSPKKKLPEKQPKQNKIMEKSLEKCDNKPFNKSLTESVSSSEPKPSPKRKKNRPAKNKSPSAKPESTTTLTKWLQQDNNNQKKEDKKKPKKNPTKPERSTKQTAKKPKKQSSSTKREQSESFEKYGLILPSYEDILNNQKRFQDHAKSLASINKLERKVLKEWDNSDFKKSTKNKPSDKKDCKSVSKRTLDEYFKQFLSTLKAYTNGRRSLERHKKFLQNKLNPDMAFDDYICFILFTQEQKEHLMGLLTSEFKQDEEESEQETVSTAYLFKVLLPELCFLIFMEEHSMNKRQANLYLQNYPI